MKSPKLKLLGTFALGAVAAFGTLFAVRAHAAGIPDADALTYTGYLENPDGTPVTDKVNITVSLWDAVAKGKQLCSQDAPDTTPVNGRFQVTLPPECPAAIQGNPNVWIDTAVGGGSLGRTKIGAVPYALEAGHATSASQAAPGTFAVPGSLTVGGNATVTGKLSVGIHLATNCTTVGSDTTCVCGAGEIAISGGALPTSSDGNGWLQASRPLVTGPALTDTWQIACKNDAGAPLACIDAYVICARLTQ